MDLIKFSDTVSPLVLCRYGEERYEKRELQQKVRECFGALQVQTSNVPWTVINAAQSKEQVSKDIWRVVEPTIAETQKGKPIQKLWQEGNFERSKSGEGATDEEKTAN